MAFPTAYTEKSLAEFMHTKLGKVATALGLAVGASDAGSYTESVYDALLAYGTDDISSISGMDNIRKLRTLAQLYVWQFVVNNFAALYDFSADGGRYNRSQLLQNAKEALQLAQAEALPYDTNYVIKIRKTDPIHDPYTVREEIDDRPL